MAPHPNRFKRSNSKFLWQRQFVNAFYGSGVKTGQWHHLMVSYDENALIVMN